MLIIIEGNYFLGSHKYNMIILSMRDWNLNIFADIKLGGINMLSNQTFVSAINGKRAGAPYDDMF